MFNKLIKNIKNVVLVTAIGLSLGVVGCTSTGSDGSEESSPEIAAENGVNVNANANANANANTNSETAASKTEDGSPGLNNPDTLVPPAGVDPLSSPPATAADQPADATLNTAATANKEELANLVGEASPASNAVPENANVKAPADAAGTDPFAPPANAVEAEVDSETPVANSSPILSASVGTLPEKGTKMAYYIRKGDTLGIIAQKIYGNKAEWKRIVKDNTLENPSKIYAGDILFYTLDDKSQAFAEKYEASPYKSVTVSKGDTLSKLSQKLMGNQAEWRTLWKLNPAIKNPDRLNVGMVIVYKDSENPEIKVANNDDANSNNYGEDDDDSAEALQ